LDLELKKILTIVTLLYILTVKKIICISLSKTLTLSQKLNCFYGRGMVNKVPTLHGILH